MMNKDIGLDYLRLKSDKDRQDFERVFIDNFAKGYRQAGAKETAFVNWRNCAFQGSDENVRVVEADLLRNKAHILLMFIAHQAGERKLVRLVLLQIGGIEPTAEQIGKAVEKL
jgi:hypothetical protein